MERIVLVLSLCSALAASAGSPALLDVQGRLENAAGISVSGTYALTFSLYDKPTGATALFTEDVLGVQATEGLFSTRLGTKSTLPTALIAAAAELWLGVAIDGGEQLTRTRLVSVPYALVAGHAAEANHAVSADTATTAHGLSCTGCVSKEALALPACAAREYLVATTTSGFECRSFELCPDGAPATLGANGPTCLTGLTLGVGLASFALDVDFGLHQLRNMRLQNAATEPAPCAATTEGLMYWNTDKKQTCVCTGTDWACGLGVPPKLGTEGNPALSCAAMTGSATGFYWVDPDGTGSINKAFTHCDMSSDGGGYTLVALWDGAQVASGWGSTTDGLPSLTVRFQLPFIAWFPVPQKVMLRYVPTGSTFATAVTGGAWQTKGFSARIAAASNWIVFSDGAIGRNGMCVVNGTYDDGYSCDGNSGQIGGAGSFGSSSEDEECSCSAAGRFWKDSFGGCTATTCNASGLVAIYMK